MLLSSCAAEESPRSDLACGEVAGFSRNCSVANSNAMVCLKEVDIPGASLVDILFSFMLWS